MLEVRQIDYSEVGNKEAQMFADTYTGIQPHFGDISLAQYRERFAASKDSGLLGLFHETHGLVAVVKYGKALKRKTAFIADLMKLDFSGDSGWVMRPEMMVGMLLLEHLVAEGFETAIFCGISTEHEPVLSANLNALDIVKNVTQKSGSDFTDVAVELKTTGE